MSDKDFKIKNGVLTKYVGKGGDVTIPEGITEIGHFAFHSCFTLTSITFPKSIEKINDSAFFYCRDLERVIFPDVEATICSNAFSNCFKLADATGFVIINNQLISYENRNVSEVVIPQGVTKIHSNAFRGHFEITSINIPNSVLTIDDWAFTGCSSLTNVVLPESVTNIGRYAFSDCESLKSINLPDGLASIDFGTFCGCNSLTKIKIPDSVTYIGSGAFEGCVKLITVEFSENIQTIEKDAFNGCNNLEIFGKISKTCKLGANVFGEKSPAFLLNIAKDVHTIFSDSLLKQYILNEDIWTKLPIELQCDIFMSRQSKTVTPVYNNIIKNCNEFGELILSRINEKMSAKECMAVATFITMCQSDVICKKLYEAIKPLKNSQKALELIVSDKILMDRLLSDSTSIESLPLAEQKVIEILKLENQTVKSLEENLKAFYGLDFNDLPDVCYNDGMIADKMVLAFLLMVHEKLGEYKWCNVRLKDESLGISDKAKDVLAEIDTNSFQSALKVLADTNLEKSPSKKTYLAYPICRYADDKLLSDLVKTAPSWRSKVSGDDAPMFRVFRHAIAFNNSRVAMLFLDKYNDLDYYAKLRGVDADTLRDKYLSDTGLDANGCKSYNLGNQTVIAKLQNDLSFVIMLENGKTAKSLPKKGADEQLYEIANNDFTQIKKDVKRIFKNRTSILFNEFYICKEQLFEEWEAVYMRNPILRKVACLLVWTTQEKITFTISEKGFISANGNEFVVPVNEKISLAHPMEMEKSDVEAWQRYFVENKIKQPFEQIWEPVIDLSKVEEDRYKDCLIPYYRFVNREKHGITIVDNNFHNEIIISLEDCDAEIERIDYERHYIDMSHNFEIKKISVAAKSRIANHQIAYFDRITAYGRILKDDVSVERFLQYFTIAQITEFIRVATENNATNVLAMLLEYKNNKFADFDPMAEFILD